MKRRKRKGGEREKEEKGDEGKEEGEQRMEGTAGKGERVSRRRKGKGS